MTVYEIAVHLQQDLIESREKPMRVRKGTESRFIQNVLEPWGYVLSSQRIHMLAAKAKSYETFILSATK